jgi:hypothetical protein
MEGDYLGFDTGKLVIQLLKALKTKGLLEEDVILQMLWDVKDPLFPWTKAEIKELIKL